ncbi:TRAP transporter substrate-binding protein DctP [Castellaniella sp.]|uniref:TRAP transporter substrate-binding protein DctP n=1 Tax=Castellaniella sp. TaxID=1955812 RepID=UPI0035634F27
MTISSNRHFSKWKMVALCAGIGAFQYAVPAYAETFPVGTIFGKDHVLTHMTQKFAESAKEKTNGDIVVQVRVGSPFGDVYQISKQVANGQRKLDVVVMSSEIDKRLAIGFMGGVASDYDQAYKLYGPDGTFLEVMNDIGDEAGYKMLAWAPTGFGGICFRKEAPETLPSDTKYKVRVAPYKGMIARFESLGFSAVPMPYSETFTALQTGAIDAKGACPAQEAAQEFADIIGSYLYSRDYFEGIIGVAVNKKWFDGLSVENKEALIEAGHEATTLAWEGAEAREEKFLKELEDKNVKVIRLSAEQYEEVKKITQESEWPVLRETIGDEIMDKIERIVAD